MARKSVESKYSFPFGEGPVDWNAVEEVIREAHLAQSRAVGRGIINLVRGAGRLVVRVLDAIFEAAAASRLYADLNRMSDRQLADIGLERDQLSNFVAKQMFKRGDLTLKDGKIVELPRGAVKAAHTGVTEIKRAA